MRMGIDKIDCQKSGHEAVQVTPYGTGVEVIARGQRFGGHIGYLRIIAGLIIPTASFADLIDGVDDPGIAGQAGKTPGLVT